MLAILSPSKTLKYDIRPQTKEFSQPQFLGEAEQLVETLREFSPRQLQNLMNINTKLADLNANRFMEWKRPFNLDNAQQALLVFKGEVFNGLKADTLTEDELIYAQDHLCILSGLYGMLRPLDLMQPYRLEMGTKLKNKKGEDLYEFWGDKITKAVSKAIEKSGSRILVNLASNEYFKSIDTKKLDAEIITPTFKDYKNGTYKFITVYGKNARGMMTRWIIKNRPKDAESLKHFEEDGYYYNDELSKGNRWVFTRG